MHEADAGEHRPAVEAAGRLAGDAVRRIAGAGGEAPLAPGVAVALDVAALVGDDGDGAEIVGVEIARGNGRAGERAHGDHAAAAAALGMHAERAEKD